MLDMLKLKRRKPPEPLGNYAPPRGFYGVTVRQCLDCPPDDGPVWVDTRVLDQHTRAEHR